MDIGILSLILDIAILGALGAGIYFAFTLSRALNNFKNNRNELKALIAALTANISKADTAIQKLKSESYETADELRTLNSESKMLSEELQLMNDAGNSLAKRLENLAEKSRKSATPQNTDGLEEWLDNTQDLDDDEQGNVFQAAQPKKVVKPAGYPFSIQDHDAVNEQDEEFDSEAERELFKALQGHGKAGR